MANNTRWCERSRKALIRYVICSVSSLIERTHGSCPYLSGRPTFDTGIVLKARQAPHRWQQMINECQRSILSVVVSFPH